MNVILAMIIMHSSPGAVPANDLATEIIKVSRLYNVDPVLLTKIAMTESHGQAYAHNATSHDYGLMQINARHQVPTKCLYNWRCNLRMAAHLISEQSKKAGWRPCMYNTGRLGANRNVKLCLQYDRKLASIY